MYVDAQPLCMRVHSVPTDPNIYEAHWYVHDRLGSVRQVVKLNEFSRAQVENRYAYTPFGEDLAAVTAETIANPFQFTGQWHDAEIGQYHLRARMYDPAMMRFTGRDPVRGGPNEPLTLHRYLYCVNDPPNRVDPSGKLSAANLVSGVITGYSLYGHGVSLAAYAVDTGDDRFWELAQTTFEFIPYALTYASVNFTGPLTNIGIYFTEGIYENARGSVTGLSWTQALAIDVWAYAGYYCRMLDKETEIGVSFDDMNDFMDWVGVQL